MKKWWRNTATSRENIVSDWNQVSNCSLTFIDKYFSKNPKSAIKFGVGIKLLSLKLLKMGEIATLKTFIFDVANECMKKEGYKKGEYGSMIGCLEKMYVSNRPLNVLVPFESISADIENALTPTKNQYNSYDIDFLGNAKKQSYYFDY